MIEKIKIGVKYCGNCNPYIDTKKLYLLLYKGLKEEVEFVNWDMKNYDILLILSSCPADCAGRPEFYGPIIAIEDINIDYYSTTIEHMGELLKGKIRLMAKSL